MYDMIAQSLEKGYRISIAKKRIKMTDKHAGLQCGNAPARANAVKL
jgi:hypothetical protein